MKFMNTGIGDTYIQLIPIKLHTWIIIVRKQRPIRIIEDRVLAIQKRKRDKRKSRWVSVSES